MFKMQENHFGKETEKLRMNPYKKLQNFANGKSETFDFSKPSCHDGPQCAERHDIGNFCFDFSFSLYCILCVVLGLFGQGRRLNSGQVMRCQMFYHIVPKQSGTVSG